VKKEGNVLVKKLPQRIGEIKPAIHPGMTTRYNQCIQLQIFPFEHGNVLFDRLIQKIVGANADGESR
jgi:hypothetical protein